MYHVVGHRKRSAGDDEWYQSEFDTKTKAKKKAKELKADGWHDIRVCRDWDPDDVVAVYN